MITRLRLAGIVLAVLVLAGLGYTGWQYTKSREPQVCAACAREIHAHTRTVATIDGVRHYYCCPACALSEHRQTAKPVEVTQLTNYLTGAPLSPANAFAVRNSDVNPCVRTHAALTPDKQPMPAQFDRCAPGILAFADRAAAETFAAGHGGQVMRFADLAAAYRQ